MLCAGSKNHSPLICIGRNVHIGANGSLGRIDCLCVSPSGRIAIIANDPYAHGESAGAFVSKMTACLHELSTWNCDRLDNIASEYFYLTSQQSARCIDVLARNGLATFSDTRTFYENLLNNLREKAIHIFISVDPDVMDMRAIEFSNSDIGASDIAFSIMRDASVRKNI